MSVPAKAPEGFRWAYEQSPFSERVQHTWSIKNERGGIHVFARRSAPMAGYSAKWIGGLECHTPPEDEPMSHEVCWLLLGPCHHDGSSLQFSEQIAPYLPDPRGSGFDEMQECHHEMVTGIMLDRFRCWIDEPIAEHAITKATQP